jgi:hypothetical protein
MAAILAVTELNVTPTSRSCGCRKADSLTTAAFWACRPRRTHWIIEPCNRVTGDIGFGGHPIVSKQANLLLDLNPWMFNAFRGMREARPELPSESHIKSRLHKSSELLSSDGGP